eukprot:1527596-Rhodomonas_salina.2
MMLPDFVQSIRKVGSPALVVKEGTISSAFLNPVPHPPQTSCVRGQIDREPLILIEVLDNQLRQSSYCEQGCCYPTRPFPPRTRYDRKTGPKRVTDGGVPIVGQRVEKEIGRGHPS